jgi:hypothetical protein
MVPRVLAAVGRACATSRLDGLGAGRCGWSAQAETTTIATRMTPMVSLTVSSLVRQAGHATAEL